MGEGDDEGSHGSLRVESSLSLHKQMLQMDPQNYLFCPFCSKVSVLFTLGHPVTSHQSPL